MTICTLYSHEFGIDQIKQRIKAILPKAKFTQSQQDENTLLWVETKNGFFGPKNQLKVVYRERRTKNVHFGDTPDCPLTKNLEGMYHFVLSQHAQNERIRKLFLLKIKAVNCEFSLVQEKGETKNLKALVADLSKSSEAFLFVTPHSIVSLSDGQHFLNEDLHLILDERGRTEVDGFGPEIERQYLENQKAYKQQVLSQLSDDQRRRKLVNEQTLKDMEVRVNDYLPAIESEEETEIRNPREVAQRLTVLMYIDGFASNIISTEKATDLLKSKSLWRYLSDAEIALLENATEEQKNQQTWKCECIWTFFWALGIVDDLGDPASMCDLSGIPDEHIPLRDPAAFMKGHTELRSKKELLDMADLYYRMDWTCVDDRLKGLETPQLNPSVVYERHYALNWLIRYMDQEWDDVSCDT